MHRMPATIQFNIFCLPVVYLQTLEYTKLILSLILYECETLSFYPNRIEYTELIFILSYMDIWLWSKVKITAKQ
jgi:hypothetical protein